MDVGICVYMCIYLYNKYACRDICIYVYKYSYINNTCVCICMHGI